MILEFINEYLTMQPWYLQLETLFGPLAILGRSSLGTKDRWLVTMNIKGVVINERNCFLVLLLLLA